MNLSRLSPHLRERVQERIVSWFTVWSADAWENLASVVPLALSDRSDILQGHIVTCFMAEATNRRRGRRSEGIDQGHPDTSAVLAQLVAGSEGMLKAYILGNTNEIGRCLSHALKEVAGKEMGHRDVGEKIGWARKDQAAIQRAFVLADIESQGPAVAYRMTTRDTVLGAYDVHVGRQAGDTAGAAYLKDTLMRSVHARPEDKPEARQLFVEACTFLREALASEHTVADVFRFIKGWGEEFWGRPILETLRNEDLPKRFPTNGSTAYGALRMAVQEAGFRGFINWSGPTLKYGEGPEFVFLYGYRDDNRLILWRNRTEPLGSRFKANVLGRTKTGTPVLWEKGWQTALKMEIEDDWSWSESAEKPEGQPGPEKKRKEAFVLVRRGLTGIREGGPVVVEGPVTGERVIRDFSLRGLEHGKWMEDTDADTGEAALYGALADLAAFLQFPAPWMGFRGKLGMAIGARGHGKFLAHYEPSFRVINLTKTKGAGALAHEWGHALDHWLTDRESVRGISQFCSHGAKSNVPAIDEAMKAVMRAIRRSPTPAKAGGRMEDLAQHRPGPDGIQPEVIKTTPIQSWNDRNDRVRAFNTWYQRMVVARNRTYGAGPRLSGNESDLAGAAYRAAVADFKKLDRLFKRTMKVGGELEPENPSSYLQAAQELGEYWARPEELFARAWECWIEDSMLSRGWKSTYLVVGTQGSYKEGSEPYPQGEERLRINMAMEDLAEVIRSTLSHD